MFVLDEVSSLQPRENVGGIATIARCVLLRYWGNSRIHCTCYSTGLGGLHNIRCLAFYSCRCWSYLEHGHNNHLPCQRLLSVKRNFGQILWNAWIGLSWYTQVLCKHMRLDPFASTTPSANCRAADALAVELSTFLCLSPLPSQVTCRLHRGVNLHLLST